MPQDNIFITLVIPAYNEGKTIYQTLDKVKAYFNKNKYTFEIIVVDDGSIDETSSLIDKRHKEDPRIRLIMNSHNMGKGFSVKRGVLSSAGRYTVFSDADLSCPIEELDKIIPSFLEGYDVIIGSRSLEESDILVRQPWFRQAMGKTFNIFVKLLFLTDTGDTQCGFKGFKRDAAYRIFGLQRLNRFCFDVEVLYIARVLGYKIKVIPVAWINRKESRVGVVKDSLRMFLDLFKIRINILRGLYNAA